ncbi:MAG: PP2C family protein-serine/threonine phosphatase, partial [Flavobacteriales bacterium]
MNDSNVKIQNSDVKLKQKYNDLYERNKELWNSIHYSQLIQQALLPKDRHFNRAFKDHFVFYEPKEPIGGDFYWVSKTENISYIAVADCTGHGIPGGMLT